MYFCILIRKPARSVVRKLKITSGNEPIKNNVYSRILRISTRIRGPPEQQRTTQIEADSRWKSREIKKLTGGHLSLRHQHRVLHRVKRERGVGLEERFAGARGATLSFGGYCPSDECQGGGRPLTGEEQRCYQIRREQCWQHRQERKQR